MDPANTISGGCLCRAVRYVCTGDPLYVGYCHCRSCRHHTGAAVAGMVVCAPPQVSFIRGTPRRFASSPGVARGFCDTCGTSLSWEGGGLMSVHIGTLDRPEAYPPTLHWRFEERTPWCDAGADLPKVTMTWPA